jgi:hypothetical protein
MFVLTRELTPPELKPRKFFSIISGTGISKVSTGLKQPTCKRPDGIRPLPTARPAGGIPQKPKGRNDCSFRPGRIGGVEVLRPRNG